MACPLCGERCSCSFVAPGGETGEHTAVLIDPDAPSYTEAQFEASLDGLERAALEAPVPEPPSAAAARYRTIALESAVPLQRKPEAPPPISEEQWRAEVSSRVQRYRRRKGTDTAACLSLDFEPSLAAEPVGEVEPRPLTRGYVEVERRSVPVASKADPFYRRRLEAGESTKVIEFPKPVEELAEPVLDKPRILEAPLPEQLELTEAPPPLAITLDPTPEEPPAPLTQIQLPIQVAAIPARATAAALDGVLVLVAFAIFALIVRGMVDTLPHGKAAVGLGFVALAVFWSVFQYLFLVYGRVTPGMQFARLELQPFQGDEVTLAQRRARALALVLSCASIGLGFAWSMVDEDALCWHDRISRTYLTQ